MEWRLLPLTRWQETCTFFLVEYHLSFKEKKEKIIVHFGSNFEQIIVVTYKEWSNVSRNQLRPRSNVMTGNCVKRTRELSMGTLSVLKRAAFLCVKLMTLVQSLQGYMKLRVGFGRYRTLQACSGSALHCECLKVAFFESPSYFSPGVSCKGGDVLNSCWFPVVDGIFCNLKDFEEERSDVMWCDIFFGLICCSLGCSICQFWSPSLLPTWEASVLGCRVPVENLYLRDCFYKWRRLTWICSSLAVLYLCIFEYQLVPT